jgi:translation initiation factor 5A
MSDDETFENTDAGASLCEKTDTNRLKPGSLVMIKGFPCKVTDVTTAKPGKHGSAKVILKGKDILTDKVYDCTYHAGDMVDAPICKRIEYTLLNIDDETLSLMDGQGEIKEDVNLPTNEHLKAKKNNIIEWFEKGTNEVLVTVLATLGKEQVIDVREGVE